MSTIGGVSGLNNFSYVQFASNGVQSTRGDSDGGNDGGSGAGQVGQGSNFMQAIMQALIQSLSRQFRYIVCHFDIQFNCIFKFNPERASCFACIYAEPF